MPPTDKHGERSFAICKDHHDADWNQPELENESCVLCRLFYLEAQEQLLEEWQQRAKRAEEAIKEMERPLDAQMARLNATVASLNAENEMLKSARSADRSQEPAAWLEVGEKSGVVGVSLERDDSSPFGWEPLYRAPVAPASSERATNTEALATMDRFINGIKAEVKKTGGFSFVGESAVYWIARFREVSEALAAPSATSAHKALLLCRQWIEADEGRSLDSILDIERRAIEQLGKGAFNAVFIEMCKALSQAIAEGKVA